MALCESFSKRKRGERQRRIGLFISANTSGVGGTNSKALKLFGALAKATGSGHKQFCVRKYASDLF